MNTKFKALLATLLIVGLLLIPSPGDANCSTWLEGYTYRKQINITGSAGAGTDYSIPLTVHSGFAIEEQTSINAAYPLYSGSKTRVGQKLTISNRIVTKLTFRMGDIGSPSGDVTFTIRQLDDTVLASKVWGDAGDLGTSDWREVTLDTPILVNEEVRISAEFSEGDASNYPYVTFQNTDVKASEGLSYYDGNWTDEGGNGNDYDCAYKYTYPGGDTAGVAYLDNHCTDFPNDIRFTDDDGDTELDHWCEDTGDPAKFWIEVADDLDDNQDIYIYFGKSGASSDSSGVNTFPIFNSGDTVVGWTDVTVTASGNVDWAVNAGKIRATAAANSAAAFLFCDTQTGINAYKLHADIIAQDGQVNVNYQQGLAHKTTQAAPDGGYARWLERNDLIKWQIYDEAGGSDSSAQDGAFDARETHEYILIRTGNDSKLYVDDALKVTHTKASWLPQYIGLYTFFYYSAHWVDFSNIFVAKYVDPEPVVGTPGALEFRNISHGYIIG